MENPTMRIKFIGCFLQLLTLNIILMYDMEIRKYLHFDRCS